MVVPAVWEEADLVALVEAGQEAREVQVVQVALDVEDEVDGVDHKMELE